jgi:hypothetical protein
VVNQLFLIEYNEINFDFARFYAAKGQLPELRQLIDRHGVRETTSEDRYEHLEPWIQWVTAHSGQTFAEHGVFRLGDIVTREVPQIWEQLEQAGLKVGAISPMNAVNRLRDPAFFVPDPWTSTRISAPSYLERLYRAIAQAVNDNAQGRVSANSAPALLRGFLSYAAPSNYPAYLHLAASSRTRPWRRAMFLDLLLADVFVKEARRTRPDFASLFLNAGAHIQHHYMFCSPAYSGKSLNPEWYVRPGDDPVLEVLQLYDRVLGRIRKAAPSARIMLATGLHQEPHEKLTFYWRLRAHDRFLRRIGVPFQTVEPRMSRDFLVVCASKQEAEVAAKRLTAAVAHDGGPMFEVDNRGTDLFCMLTYPREVTAGFWFTIGNERFESFDTEVAFVAVKNGEHHGIGYFIDTGESVEATPSRFPLAELPARIAHALRVDLECARRPA